MRQLVQLEKDLSQFEAKKATVAAIAVQDQARAQKATQVAKVSYSILADPDHRVTEAYGVYNLLGDGVATPSVFIIDQTGHIVWSYIGQNDTDRPDNQTILDYVPLD